MTRASAPGPSRRVGFAVAGADETPVFYELVRASAGDPDDDRPVVVLCDGIGCDGYVWKYVRRVLTEHVDLLHWHYRGHGRTPAPRDPERVAIADLADDLADVLDDAEVDRAILFGHSMGVQVALETYRRHRDRIVGLGLFCGAPGNPLRTFKRTAVLERLLPGVRAAVRRAPALTGRLTRALVPTGLSYAIAAQIEVNGKLLDQADFMPYLRGLAQVDPQLFLAMLASAGKHSAEDLLPSIAVPTLVVAGSRDGFTPPERSQQMADAIPGADFLLVHDGSHTAPLERPHYVNEAVMQFMLRNFGPLGRNRRRAG
jgi:pimeloyl-ACP methyl ester carboxylesterase